MTGLCNTASAVGLFALAASACAVSSKEPTPEAASGPVEAKGGCSLSDGLHALTVEGQRREFVVARGPGAPAGRRPIVFIWHGFGGYSPRIVSLIEGALWPQALRIAPKGLPRTFEDFGDVAQLGWQVRKGEYGDRDLAFFDALYAQLEAEGCLDPTQVYTTGFSNGGFFSNLLACHRASRIAAAAPTGGGGPFEACEGTVPVLIHHGIQDRVVPFSMADGTFRAWSKHQGCTSATPSGGCVSADGCAVALCTSEVGHRWPAGASARIVDFFKRHRRPPSPDPSRPASP